MEIVDVYGIIFTDALSSPESISDAQALPFRLGRSKGLRGLAFGLVLLGGCVFGWGLRYKLSLYQPPHSLSKRMPEAKLLSGKECGEFDVVHMRPAFRTDLPLALETLALAFVLLAEFRMGSGWHAFGAAAALPRRAPQSIPRLSSSIRPPPRRH